MKIEVKALHALSHDNLRLARGEVGEMSEAAASELQAKGLIEIVKTKKAPEAANKKAPDPENKSKK